MTLPSSGGISIAQIRAEMDGTVASLVFPAANTLWLAGKSAAPIVLPTDYYGKTWGPSGTPTTFRFGADASPGSTWTLPSGAPWAVGDLVVVCQLAQDSSAPADVIPAGWTRIGTTITAATGDGNNVRVNTSYRIITAGQLGTTITGMNGAQKNRVCAAIYHFNRALTGVTVVDSSRNASAAAAGAVIPNWDSTRDGSHLYIGHCHGELSVADADFTWSTAPDDKGSATVTRTYYKFYDNTAPVSAITMTNGADNGTFNAVQGTLLRLK
jgi:hypothetical protein